jgi:hypothetical protein
VILVLLWNNRFRRREEKLESDRISWATREREREGSHSHILSRLVLLKTTHSPSMHEKRKIYIQKRESETLTDRRGVEGRRGSRRKIIKQAEQRQNVNELTTREEKEQCV